MGIFKSFRSAWKAASTAEKMNLVLDIICGVGTGIVAGRVTEKLLPGMNKVERVCTSIAMSGLGMAAGTAASKAYGEYTAVIGQAIDSAKEKKEQKEESEDAGE